MDFHVLYEQIWLSEQKAQERKLLLNEVKNDIYKVQKQIKETQESGILLGNQLRERLMTLSEEEENALWFSRRQEALQDKLDTIRKEVNQHHRNMVELQESNKAERTKFLSEVNAFSNSYDLGGKGQTNRQIESRQYLKDLGKQQEQLETDIAVLGEQQCVITSEEDKKADLEIEIKQLKGKLNGLAENQVELHSKTKRLELVKTQVSNIPNTDPEFKRLRAELESCQDDTMQGVCQALQQELDRLQRKRWQQQVQRQQDAAAKKAPSNLRPYQTNQPTIASGTNRPFGGQFIPSYSSANTVPSSNTQSVTTKPTVGKFKPNLAKLRKAAEQRQQNSTLQQHPNLPSASSSTQGPSAPTFAKQAKKVRFENTKWK